MPQVNAMLFKGRYQTVRLRDLVTEDRFNRPISESWIAELMSTFSAERFGCIELWARDDGTFVILDGQHRTETLRRLGVREDIKCVPAIVHYDLKLDKAAELFVWLNHTKIIGPLNKFKALLTAGHRETTDIDQIVRAQGLTVGGNQDGRLGCIVALRWLYNLGEPRGAVLARTLATLHGAWATASEAYTQAMVRGVGRYLNKHRDVTPGDLAEALIRGPGAPINLTGWAKAVAGTQRMPLDAAIAMIVEDRVMNRRPRPRKAASA
jgi:hypothetical protein